jgi:hypothetical protein
MSMIHSTTADSFTPEDIGGLVDLAVKKQSIAARSATVYSTDKFKVSFPKWTADPAVSFYNELDTIAATDGTTDEVSGLVYKTAGITRVSNELRRLGPLDRRPRGWGAIQPGRPCDRCRLPGEYDHQGTRRAVGPVVHRRGYRCQHHESRSCRLGSLR